MEIPTNLFSFSFLIMFSLGEILVVKKLVMFDGHPYFINVCWHGNSNIKLFLGLLLASS